MANRVIHLAGAATIILCSFTWPAKTECTPILLDYIRGWIMDDNRGYLAVKDNFFELRLGDGLDDRFTFGAGLEAKVKLDTIIVDAIRYRVFINSYTSNAYAHLYYTDDEHFRVDLFTHMMIAERRFGRLFAFAGVQATFAGNWGGELIQNGFHTLIGYELVEAPYIVRTWFDIGLPFGARIDVIDIDLWVATIYVALYCEGILGLSSYAKHSLWGGVEVSAQTGAVSGSIVAGYKLHAAAENAIYRHMYSTGPFLTFAVSIEAGPVEFAARQAYNVFGSKPTEWTADNRNYLWSVAVGGRPDRTPGLFFH